MAVKSAQVSVGTTATALSGADPGNAGGSPDGQSVAVSNPAGGATVYLGGSDVAVGNGYALAAGSSMSADLGGGEALYGIVASGTVTVSVLRTGV